MAWLETASATARLVRKGVVRWTRVCLCPSFVRQLCQSFRLVVHNLPPPTELPFGTPFRWVGHHRVRRSADHGHSTTKVARTVRATMWCQFHSTFSFPKTSARSCPCPTNYFDSSLGGYALTGQGSVDETPLAPLSSLLRVVATLLVPPFLVLAAKGSLPHPSLPPAASLYAGNCSILPLPATLRVCAAASPMATAATAAAAVTPGEEGRPGGGTDVDTDAAAAAADAVLDGDGPDGPAGAANGAEAEGDAADIGVNGAANDAGEEEEEEEEEEGNNADREADGDDGGPALPPAVAHLRFRNYKPRDPLLKQRKSAPAQPSARTPRPPVRSRARLLASRLPPRLAAALPSGSAGCTSGMCSFCERDRLRKHLMFSTPLWWRPTRPLCAIVVSCLVGSFFFSPRRRHPSPALRGCVCTRLRVPFPPSSPPPPTPLSLSPNSHCPPPHRHSRYASGAGCQPRRGARSCRRGFSAPRRPRRPAAGAGQGRRGAGSGGGAAARRPRRCHRDGARHARRVGRMD